MKRLFNRFSDSAKCLRETRTLTTTGVMLALAVVLRSMSVPITEDIRIVFSFVPICVIGMLYGPVVCAMANVSLDIIGFMVDTKTMRGYSPQLSLLEFVIGTVYGLILYKRTAKFCGRDIAKIISARLVVVGILNICVRSYLMYTMYVNPGFSLFAADPAQRQAFLLYLDPRIVKSAVEFPVDIIIMSVMLPVSLQAYSRSGVGLRNEKNT